MDVLQWECGVGSSDVFVKLSPQFDVAVFFGSWVVVCLRHLRGHVERIHTFILIHTTTTAGYKYIYIYKPAGGHQNVRVFVRIVLQRKERSTRGPIHIVSVPEGKNSSVYCFALQAAATPEHLFFAWKDLCLGYVAKCLPSSLCRYYPKDMCSRGVVEKMSRNMQEILGLRRRSWYFRTLEYCM